MTERKPPGVSWQTWIDSQIDDAQANGEFDDLPGYGKPLAGIDRPRDELWWVRDKLRREEVEYLPPALAIRREAEQAEQQALAAPTQAEAERILDEINAKIRYLNSHTIDGPPTTLMPLDVDEVLDRWRAQHPPPPERASGESAGPRRSEGPELGRRPWWWPLSRR